MSCCRTGRGASWRSAIRSSIGRSSRRSGFPRPACCRSCRTSPISTSPPDPRVLDAYDDEWTNILFVGRVIPNKRPDNLIRFFHAYKTLYNPRARLILAGSYGGFETYLAQLHALVASLGVARRAHPWAGHQRRADGALRRRRPVSLRQRARRLLRAAHRGVPQARAGHRATRRRPCRRRWMAAACCTRRTIPRHVAALMQRRAHRMPTLEADGARRAGCRARRGCAAQDFDGTLLRLRRRRCWRRRASRRRRSPTTSGGSSRWPTSSKSIRADAGPPRSARLPFSPEDDAGGRGPGTPRDDRQSVDSGGASGRRRRRQRARPARPVSRRGDTSRTSTR